MLRKNKMDLNYITDFAAVVSQLNSCINPPLINSLCDLIATF